MIVLIMPCEKLLPLRSLLEVSIFVLLRLRHFVQLCLAHCPVGSSAFMNLLQVSQFIQRNGRYNRPEQPKNTSCITKLSMEDKNFPPFGHRHLTRRRLKTKSVVFAQCITRTFADKSKLLDNP